MRYTKEQRKQIYINAISYSQTKWQGVCYVLQESLGLGESAELEFPEWMAQKPEEKSESHPYWWSLNTNSGNERRIEALQRAIRLCDETRILPGVVEFTHYNETNLTEIPYKNNQPIWYDNFYLAHCNNCKVTAVREEGSSEVFRIGDITLGKRSRVQRSKIDSFEYRTGMQPGWAARFGKEFDYIRDLEHIPSSILLVKDGIQAHVQKGEAMLRVNELRALGFKEQPKEQRYFLFKPTAEIFKAEDIPAKTKEYYKTAGKYGYQFPRTEDVSEVKIIKT